MGHVQHVLWQEGGALTGQFLPVLLVSVCCASERVSAEEPLPVDNIP